MKKSIKKFVQDRVYLFWWINKQELENISEKLLVENILNYGNLQDIKELFNLLGEKKVANIFFDQTTNKRINYHKKTENFFRLYFSAYA